MSLVANPRRHRRNRRRIARNVAVGPVGANATFSSFGFGPMSVATQSRVSLFVVASPSDSPLLARSPLVPRKRASEPRDSGRRCRHGFAATVRRSADELRPPELRLRNRYVLPSELPHPVRQVAAQSEVSPKLAVLNGKAGRSANCRSEICRQWRLLGTRYVAPDSGSPFRCLEPIYGTQQRHRRVSD